VLDIVEIDLERAKGFEPSTPTLARFRLGVRVRECTPTYPESLYHRRQPVSAAQHFPFRAMVVGHLQRPSARPLPKPLSQEAIAYGKRWPRPCRANAGTTRSKFRRVQRGFPSSQVARTGHPTRG